MSCLGGRLADLVDGRLDVATGEQVLAHVARCGPCREEVVALRALRSLLAGSPTPQADDDLVDRLSSLPVTAPLPVYRGPAPVGTAGHGRARGAAAVAGGAAAVVVALAWAGAGGGAVGTVTPAPVAPQVVPQVDRYTVEHVASIEGLPLGTPGSGVVQVAYGTASVEFATARPQSHPAQP